LSIARRRNSLRAWLAGHLGRSADAATVDRLAREAASSSAPAQWTLEGRDWRRYRGRLMAVTNEAVAGTLQVTPVARGGVPQSLLNHARWIVRQGGERFQRAPHTTPRSLKKQFQAAGVPPWARNAPLLVTQEGTVLFVPGLGTDARALMLDGAPRVTLDWRPSPAGPDV
jgi:tRNA(Ile)-lysidine synthase